MPGLADHPHQVMIGVVIGIVIGNDAANIHPDQAIFAQFGAVVVIRQDTGFREIDRLGHIDTVFAQDNRHGQCNRYAPGVA